jgi:hypothetical protein
MRFQAIKVIFLDQFLNRGVISRIDETLVLRNTLFKPLLYLLFEVRLASETKRLSTKRLDNV